MMMKGNKMPMAGFNPSSMMSDDDSDQDDMQDDEKDNSKSGKLLALQNMLGAIEELAGDDLKPYIEEIKNKLHMAHEQAENDSMGVSDAMGEDSGLPDKAAMGVDITMGKAPTMGESSDDEEDDEDAPKGGFLAILAKKMKNKGG